MVLTCASAFTSTAPSLLQSKCRSAARSAVTPFCSLKPVRSVGNTSKPAQVDFAKLAATSTAVTTLLAAGNAQAAQEVANLAARDNRAGTLLLLLAPALGWVAFNILGPALNQFKGMQPSAPAKRGARGARSVAIGLGLSAAALLSSQTAEAADEIAQLSAGRDNRVAIIATLFLPAVGWVGFNILGPALNQFKAMQTKNTGGQSSKNPLKKRR